MKKTIVKVLAAVLVIMTVFTTCACAFASGADEREEPTRFSVINTAALSFTITGATAKAGGSLTAKRNTSLQIVMTLQKKNSNGTWSNVQTCSKSGSGTVLNLTGSKVINVLNTYRVKGTFTAGGETTTIYRYH